MMNAYRRVNVLGCEGVNGRDSLWPWQQGWRGLMSCCSGWKRPEETTSTPGQYNLQPNATPQRGGGHGCDQKNANAWTNCVSVMDVRAT